MGDIIYANGFRIAMSGYETQICFRCDTPIIDESNGEITGVNQEVVADVRINPMLARELCEKLNEQLDSYDKIVKDNTNE